MNTDQFEIGKGAGSNPTLRTVSLQVLSSMTHLRIILRMISTYAHQTMGKSAAGDVSLVPYVLLRDAAKWLHFA